MIGVVTTGSRKNLLTVVAMVSVIPMVNQLVILIALWKYQPCPDKEYEQVASIVGKGILDTELVITSKTDKSFLLDYACIHDALYMISHFHADIPYHDRDYPVPE